MLICLTLVLFMMAHLISVEMICGQTNQSVITSYKNEDRFLDLFKKLDNVERSNIKLIAKACSKHNSDKWRVLDKSLHETPVVDVVSTFNYKYIRYIADDSENTRDCNTPTRTDRNAFSVMMEY